MGRRSGLGKGLSALIPDAPPAPPAPPTGDSALRELPVQSIRPNTYQPRTEFEDDALASLTASVRALGVLQPVLVRPAGDEFELIAGERRWRAAQEAGLTTIPALVREVTDTASLEQALVENLQRQDLTALEEAAAYAQLGEEFDLSQDDIARRVGKSRSAVANTLRLLQLPPSVARLVNDRMLSAGHARTLLGLDDDEAIEALAQRVVADGLSVRATEDAVKKLQAAAATADDPPAAPGATRSASLLELEDLLSEHLDTRVHVQMTGSGRGRIVVDFSGLEDLERVYRVLTEGREPQL